MAAARVLTSTSEVAAFGPVGEWDPGGPSMTDIDPGAEISIGRSYDVNQDHDGVVPLAERLDREWIRWYQRLARVKGIGARRRSSGGEQRQDGYSRLRCARSDPRVAGYGTGLVQGSRRGAGEAAADCRSRVGSPLVVV